MLHLTNNNNDCYLNSSIQILLNIPIFNSLFNDINYRSPEILKLFKYIIDTNKSTKILNGFHIKKILSNYSQLFNNNEQQDCHETIIILLTLIHENYKIEYDYDDIYLSKESYKSWIKEINLFGYSYIIKNFMGQFKNITKCNNCDYNSIQYDNFNSLSLQITDDNSSINDCLYNFIKNEKLNDAICEKCKNKTLIKKTTIWKFPNILIIQLNRFIYINNYITRKINYNVLLQDTINIKSNNYVHNYKLNSYIEHFGGNSANIGHYTANIFYNNEWYNTNDDVVKKINRKDKSNNVYIMIYENC